MLGDILFLWPGLCFYDLDYLKKRVVDFQWLVVSKNKHERLIFDTGSANAQTLYIVESENGVQYKYDQAYYLLSSMEEAVPFKYTVEVFGDFEWLHLIRASGGLSAEKKELLAYSGDFKDKLINKLEAARTHYEAIVSKGLIGYLHIAKNQVPFEQFRPLC